MTLKQKIDELNELATKGCLEVHYEQDNHTYRYTVKDGSVYFEDSKCSEPFDTMENRAKIIDHQRKLLRFITGALKSINIIIDDLEENYDVLTFDKSYMVLCKHKGNEYTFIEYTGELFGLYAVRLAITKLNLDTNDLIFDRINFNEQRHYHKDSKISEFTLECINKSWNDKKVISHNDYYDVCADDAKRDPKHCASCSMSEYGSLTGDINLDALDKEVCEVTSVYSDTGKPRIRISNVKVGYDY